MAATEQRTSLVTLGDCSRPMTHRIRQTGQSVYDTCIYRYRNKLSLDVPGRYDIMAYYAINHIILLDVLKIER
jgi:hypothetical protein